MGPAGGSLCCVRDELLGDRGLDGRNKVRILRAPSEHFLVNAEKTRGVKVGQELLQKGKQNMSESYELIKLLILKDFKSTNES